METVLGLLGVIVFIVAVISLAAAVTFLVVKLTPKKAPKPAADEPNAESA